MGDPEVGGELRIPACSPHCVQRALTVAPSVPLVKTLFTERMCLYLLCVFRERKISSLSISLNLITFQNYAFSGCLCHSFPSLVHYGWTCDGCFDVAFPSPPPPRPQSVAYDRLSNSLMFTAIFALAFQHIW